MKSEQQSENLVLCSACFAGGESSELQILGFRIWNSELGLPLSSLTANDVSPPPPPPPSKIQLGLPPQDSCP